VIARAFLKGWLPPRLISHVIRPNLAGPMNETEYATNIGNRLLDIGFNIENETKLYEEPIGSIAWR
jgi:hypothetical protein